MAYASDPYSGQPPVYVLTKGGLKTQEELEAARKKPEEKKYFLGSPWLSSALLLALLAYFFNSNEWLGAAESYIEKKQQAVGIEPYRFWASRNPLSYADVAASPAGYTGKAVIWDITVTVDGASYCEGDPGKKVFLSGANFQELAASKHGEPFKALARIEGAQEEAPLLLILQP